MVQEPLSFNGHGKVTIEADDGREPIVIEFSDIDICWKQHITRLSEDGRTKYKVGDSYCIISGWLDVPTSGQVTA